MLDMILDGPILLQRVNGLLFRMETGMNGRNFMEQSSEFLKIYFYFSLDRSAVRGQRQT